MEYINYIYVAGLLTPRGFHAKNGAIDYICNMKQLIDVAAKLIVFGYVPFCPALDFLIFLRSDLPITEAMIKHYSMQWLRKCDAVLLTPGWELSTGTKAEIEEATRLGIPVFHTFEEFTSAQL